MQTRRHAVVLGFALALAAGLAHAQGDWPNKPIRMIVPYPPGGGTDVVARIVNEKLSQELGQPIVIDNKGGAGGSVGTEIASKAAPDGYTILLTLSSHTINPKLFPKLGYDVERDFIPISLAASIPQILVANPSVPASNMQELLAWMKANPGKVNYGSAGPGSITHLGAELLKVETGTDAVHVPYKGAAPAVTDMLGGQVQFGILDVPVLLPHIRSGKLRALAITSGKRAATLPEVPTTGELGYPKVNSDNWYGLVGPLGLPPAILKRINAAAVAALNSAEVAEQYAKVGGVPMPSTPEEFAVYLAQDQAKWGGVVKAIGFKAQ